MDRILLAGKATVGATGAMLAILGAVSFTTVLPDTAITYAALVAAVIGAGVGFMKGGS